VTRLVVDLDELARSVERMRLFQEHLIHAHDAVDSRMRELHVVWTGDAASAQASAQEHWAAGARDVQEALAALSSIAHVAHLNYTAAVTANRRMWSG
jgi:WXG100 family type VII secretion target